MSDSSNALDRPRKKAEHIGLSAAHNPKPEDDTAIDLAAVWSTLRRSKWMILTVCVLVTAAAAGLTWVLPPSYEAKSIVAVETKPDAPMRVMTMTGAAPELAAEIGILNNSGELAARVLSTMRSIADTSEAEFTLFAPTDDGASVDRLEATERLKAMVTYEGDEEESMIEIIAASESPEEAAFLANVIAEEYRLFTQEMARAGVVAARTFLEGQLEKRKEDIREIEEEWESFARSNAVVTEGPDGQNVAQEYVDLQTQRDALEFQLEGERRLLAVLQEQLRQRQPSLRSSVLAEQRAQSLRTQIQALEEQIAELKTQAEQYYINDPSLRGNEDRVRELAEIKRRIDGFESRKVTLTEELVSVTDSTQTAIGDGTTSITQVEAQRNRIQEQQIKIDQMEAQIRSLNGRISAYQGRIQTLPRQTIQREQLDRRLTQAEQFYKDIAMELQRTIIAEESELGYVKVMRSAVVPMMPVSPDMQQNVILGLLLGLGLGLGGAFVRQSLNWQIYEPQDIQEQGYSLVGVIPDMTREIRKAFKNNDTIEVEGSTLSTSLLPLLNPWSPITENYRLVRANLQFSAGQNGEASSVPQLLMVTSPEPGDGKTTTAVNLAITIALSGRKVLLIDGDLRRPNAHRMLGVDRSPGLADLLEGEREVDTIQHTLIDDLFFLPAGEPSVPPTEMFDSERMSQLLALGRERFDVIIIDTPPVLAASDALVIATQCDATLVVASADGTDFRALDQVKSTLGAVGVPIGGVIFNRYNVERAGGSYKYGYGYNYEYDYAPKV